MKNTTFRFQKMMDLPPDKARILRGYDSSKKWELVCDQEKWESNERRYQGTPLEYIEKLLTFLADNTKSTNKKVGFCGVPVAETYFIY